MARELTTTEAKYSTKLALRETVCLENCLKVLFLHSGVIVNSGAYATLRPSVQGNFNQSA
jgi:hypothetical protein